MRSRAAAVRGEMLMSLRSRVPSRSMATRLGRSALMRVIVQARSGRLDLNIGSGPSVVPMKILVTGATGSVGREVVAQLRARGHAVRAVARDPGAARLPGGTEVVPGDLADPASIAAQVGDTEAVFLLWPFVSAGLTARLAPEVTKVLAAGPGRIVH